MPYIKDKDRRKELDKVVYLMNELNVKADGDLNYILFKYGKYFTEKRYNVLKNYMGELNEAAEEIRRKILAPYENEQELRNGSV